MDRFEYIDRTEPDSPTPTPSTPTATSVPPSFPPSPRSHSFSELKQIGRDIYKQVWDEFYAWEPGDCAQILGTIPQSLLASKRQVARVAKAMVARLVDAHAQPGIPPSDTSSTADTVVMSVTHFDVSDAASHPGRVHRRTRHPIPVITIDAYPPHPKYESCPPVSRSVLVGGTQEHTLAFLPYADDDRFPAQAYQARFEVLEWETPFDPDSERTCSSFVCVATSNLLGVVVEMIQIETVRRLHAMDNVSIEDINRMQMFKDFRVSHNTGLQWDQSQR